MKRLTIGDMIRALVQLPSLPTYQQSFILSAAERSKQGSDTSLLSDKEVEIVHAAFIEHCT